MSELGSGSLSRHARRPLTLNLPRTSERGEGHFQAASGIVIRESHPVIEEGGWFSDETDAFLGVLTRDKIDDDWGYAVLARDDYFRFRAIENEVSLESQYKARMKLQFRMAQLCGSPQRIFPQK